MADWLAERREFGIVCTDQLTFRDAWRSAMSPTSSNSSRSASESRLSSFSLESIRFSPQLGVLRIKGPPKIDTVYNKFEDWRIFLFF
jgi:hypothetical protein